MECSHLLPSLKYSRLPASKAEKREWEIKPVSHLLEFHCIFPTYFFQELGSPCQYRQHKVERGVHKESTKAEHSLYLPMGNGLAPGWEMSKECSRNKVPKEDKNRKSGPMISKYLPSSSDSSCTDSGVEQLLSVFWLWLDGWSLVLRRLQSLADFWIKQGLKETQSLSNWRLFCLNSIM